MARLVAIHQPNFFPWLGYFEKIRRADVFVVMDNAQFPKTGGTWSNRVRMALGGQARWLTMPVVRSFHGLRTYTEMHIDDSRRWRPTLLKTLRTHYARAPHLGEVLDAVEPLVACDTRGLAEFNLCCIEGLLERLGIDRGKLVLGSTLGCEGSATDLLVAMVKAVGGTAYLCGMGCAYQEDEKFAAAGLDLVRQDFVHPEYPQCNTAEFLPGLSVLDAALNCGFDGAAALLRRAA